MFGPISSSIVYPSPSLGYVVRTWAHLCAKTVCRACVGILSVLRLRAKAPSLCSGCGRKHPLCAQTVCHACMRTRSVLWVVAKVHPHCSQTVCCACMGTRSVLKLLSKRAPGLCSEYFLVFLFLPLALCHTSLWTRNEKRVALTTKCRCGGGVQMDPSF